MADRLRIGVILLQAFRGVRLDGSRENLRHLRPGCSLGILVAIDFLIKVLAAERKRQRVEQAVGLPGLPTERERLDTGLFQRRCGGDKLRPVFRNFDARLLEGFIGKPQPLPGVDVDRRAINLAVDGAAVKQARGLDDVFPVALCSNIGQVAHQACLNKLFRLPAVVELGCAHRVAAGDAADHDRPGRAARTGNRTVNPFVTGGVESLGQFGDRGGFAARCPPMGHLKIGGPGDTRRNHDAGQKGRRNNTHSHESPPSLKRYSWNVCEDF